MRIATFNLENLESRDSDPDDFKRRLDILRPQLQRLDADILCLQEITGKRRGDGVPLALELLLRDTPYAEFHTVSTGQSTKSYPTDPHFLAIASRWPITAEARIQHDLVPPPPHVFLTADPPDREPLPLIWDRPILYARILLPDGAPLHIVNVHLKAPLSAAIPGRKLGPFSWTSTSAWAEGYYIAALKRAGQALETRMFVDSLFDEDPTARILVTGDFNAEEREVPARIIVADLEDTSNLRLANRVLAPLDRSLAGKRRFTVIHQGRKMMLDHMFASRSLLSFHVESEIHNEALGEDLVACASIGRGPESDHAPMVAEFRLDFEK